jgi:type I restriction enzyme M protein
MLGAIIGDIVGSRFEGHHRCIHTKKFDFFYKDCHLTDDSVMSLAVADALLHRSWDEAELAPKAIACMREWARKAKHGGYGGSFRRWLFAETPQPPYNSFGNGGAMRVGPCGYAGKDLAEVKKLAAIITGVTHNHPEGLASGEAVAVAIFMARTGKTQEEIKQYIQDNYYDLDFTIDGIRDTYEFSCKAIDSVPQAIEAFCEATSFEDAIRNAISIGEIATPSLPSRAVLPKLILAFPRPCAKKL